MAVTTVGSRPGGDNPIPASYYVTGGTLSWDAQSYVARQADHDLKTALEAGEYAYVLDTRQMGKSSLMVRTAQHLRQNGFTLAVLDLTALGHNLSAEQWYEGLLLLLAEQIPDCEDNLEDFWQEHASLGPMQRFFEAIGQVVLPACPKGLVLFVDEIDATRSLPFSADEFFGGIRQCYHRRLQDTDYARLCFCLLGVATPSDLVRDTRLSPFNIGKRIALRDFTRSEAEPLARGMGNRGDALLDRVLFWTGGHPYLTQRLCQAVAEAGEESISPTTLVDSVCGSLFLSVRARESDDNLAFVRNRLLRSELDTTALLELYGRVRAGKRVRDDAANALCSVLRLSGIVTVDARGFLQVRNRIYTTVFDKQWLRDSLPNAEQERQKAAFRSGIVRTAGVAAAVVAVTGALAVRATQLQQIAVTEKRAAIHERQNAERLATQAQQSAEVARKERDRARVAEHLATNSAAAAKKALAAEAIARTLAAQSAEGERRQRQIAQAQTQVAEAQTRVATTAGVETKRLLYTASMGLAQQAWEASDIRRLDELLRETAASPDRAFEWYYLNRLRHLDRRTLPLARGEVTVLTVASGGKTLLTGDASGDLRAFDIGTGTVLRTVTNAHPGGVTALAVSRNGGEVATGGKDHCVRLWDATTGRPRRTIGPLSGEITTLCFAPHQRQQLFVGVAGGAARLIDARTGAETLRFPELAADGVYSASYAPNGRHIVVAGKDRTARIWDTETGRSALVLEGHTERIYDVAWSPADPRIATASSDGTARIWDAETGRLLETLQGHTNEVKAVDFSADGRYLTTGSSDGSARLWEASDGQLIRTFRGHLGPLNALTFAPDNRTLLTGGTDRTVRVWDALTDRQALVIQGFNGNIPSANLSPDGRRVAVACEDGTVHIRSTQNGRELRVLPRQDTQVNVVLFNPDGRQIAMGDFRGNISLWDVSTGKRLRVFAPLAGAVWELAFQSDGARLAAAGQDDRVHVYDLHSGKTVLSLPGHGSKTGISDRVVSGAVSFSPTGETLVTSTARSLFLWDARTGRRLATASEQRDRCGTWAMFSRDGKHIVTTGRGGASVWNALALSPVCTLEGHSGEVWSADFSSDGKRVVTGSRDGTARVWSATSGRELLTLRTQDSGGVNACQFAPDERYLMTAGQDGTVRLWLADDKGIDFSQNFARQERESRLRDIHALLDQMRWSEAAEGLTRELRETPDDVNLRRLRGQAYAELGQLDLAATDLGTVSRETRRPTDTAAWAQALLAAGNTASYRTLTAQLSRRPMQLLANGGPELAAAAWTLALAPTGPLEASVGLSSIGRALRNDPRRPDLLTTQGVLLYRANRFAEALTTLQQAETLRNSPTDLLFIAMAQQKLGRKEAASEAWERARAAVDAALTTPTTWERRVDLTLFRKEAETLFGP